MQIKKPVTGHQNYTVDPNLIRATLVGPYMIAGIALVLVIAGTVLFVADDGPEGFYAARVGILALTWVICIAIAYVPVKRIIERHALIRFAEGGQYGLSLTPTGVTLRVGADDYAYAFRDFAAVGPDTMFVNEKRQFSALVLSRKQTGKLSYRQTLRVIRPVIKGWSGAVTYDGVTTIPLVYFGDGPYREITQAAHDAHLALRAGGAAN